MTQPAGQALTSTFEASFQTDDADELSDFVSRNINPVQIRPADGAKSVSLQGNFGMAGGAGFWRAHYDTGAEMTPLSQFDGYFLYMPVSGALTAEVNKEVLVSEGNRAFIADGAQFKTIHVSADRTDMGLYVDRAALTRRLSRLLDKPLRTPLAFNPQIEMRDGPGAALHSLLTCLNSPAFGAALNASPLTAEQMSSTLVDLFLETLPNNYKDQLAQDPTFIGPRHVKKAIDYIKAHAQETINVDDLAERSSCSIRALQYGFQQFVGMSPKDYILTEKLVRARKDLESRKHDSVSTVARRWGFTNTSRFTEQFKSRFGTSPRELRMSA